MNTIIKILFKTNDTFDYLDKKYPDKLDLDLNCNLIFMIDGAISALIPTCKNCVNHEFFYILLSILLGASLGFLFSRYIITYIIYIIGRFLKGHGKIDEIRIVTAYSLIPNLLLQPVILYFEFTNKTETYMGIKYWVIGGLIILIWFWTVKIMVQGIIRFNGFRCFKALINVSPFIVVGLIEIIWYLK